MAPPDPLAPVGPSSWTFLQWVAVASYALAFVGMTVLVARFARPTVREDESRAPEDRPRTHFTP
jgi:hypothetical protein